MKTTFREVFNNFEDDLMNIDENSIYQDLNIDIDINKVKEKVFEQLNTNTDIKSNNSNSQKRYSKKFKISLIAAVVAVSMILGSTAIYASGTIQGIFGSFFGGNLNSAGLYDGKNVTFESPDSNINAQLLGITGDERQIYAVVEVSHKDGTPVTDEGFNRPYWYVIDNDAIENLENDEDYYNYLSCDAYLVDEDGNSLKKHAVSELSMGEDAKTLKIMFKLITEGKDMSDNKMIVESRSVGAHKVLDVVATKKSLEDEYVYFDDEIGRKIEAGEELEGEYATLYNGDCYEYCKVETKQFELPFTMSFEMDINGKGYIDKKLTTENAPNIVLPEADKVNMEITPFSINITAEADMQVYRDKGGSIKCKYLDFICCKDIDYNNSKVILNDGTEYFLYYYPAGGNNMIEEGAENDYYEEVVVLNFSKVIAPLEAEVNLIDTREIKQVIINGDTVYEQ